MILLAALALAAGPSPAALLGPPQGPPLTGEPLRAQTHEAAKLLRCVVCQGLSVADSPSETALAMRDEVQTLAAAGYDTEQILFYFEASYGEFVRLEPKAEGINLIVWGAPVAFLVAGAGALAWNSRRSRPPGTQPLRTDPDDAYLRRVREETR